MKWWGFFTLTSVVSLTLRGPEHFQSHHSVSLALSIDLSWILAASMFFQVPQVPWLLGCQLHASPCVLCAWEVGIWHSPNPQPTNSHLFYYFLSFFLSSQRTSLGKH